MVKRRPRTLRDFTTNFVNRELTWWIFHQSFSKIESTSTARFFARPIHTGPDWAVFSRHKLLKTRFARNSPDSRKKITQQNGKRPRSKEILGILPDRI